MKNSSVLAFTLKEGIYDEVDQHVDSALGLGHAWLACGECCPCWPIVRAACNVLQRLRGLPSAGIHPSVSMSTCFFFFLFFFFFSFLHLRSPTFFSSPPLDDSVVGCPGALGWRRAVLYTEENWVEARVGTSFRKLVVLSRENSTSVHGCATVCAGRSPTVQSATTRWSMLPVDGVCTWIVPSLRSFVFHSFVLSTARLSKPQGKVHAVSPSSCQQLAPPFFVSFSLSPYPPCISPHKTSSATFQTTYL